MKRKIIALLPVIALATAGYTVVVTAPSGSQQSGSFTYGKG